MFQDEARFGRISDTCYCWAKKPIRPMVQAMLTYQYTYAYGVVSPIDGRFDSLVLPHVNGYCMKLFINEIASRYPQENIWDELREKWFHNIVFDSLDALEDQLVTGLKALQTNPNVVKLIAGWDWIINCVSNGN